MFGLENPLRAAVERSLRRWRRLDGDAECYRRRSLLQDSEEHKLNDDQRLAANGPGGRHVTRTYLRSGGLAVVVAAAAIGLSACGVSSSPKVTSLGNTSAGDGRTDVRARSPGAGVAIDPAYFSPGACVAFPPTMGNRHLTVFLDAGHGGLDPGAVGVTESGRVIYEADQTLPVVLDTMTILRRAGFRVVVSCT